MIVVTPLGTLPEPLPARLVAQLEASVAAGPVIADLGQITLVSAAPVMGLAAWLLGASHQPDRCCVVCPRPTARALLRKRKILPHLDLNDFVRTADMVRIVPVEAPKNFHG